MRVLRIVTALQDQTTGDVHHDIAFEPDIMRALAERHLGRDGAGEIFLGDTLKPVRHMGPQRVARFDLMTRNPDIHRLLLDAL